MNQLLAAENFGKYVDLGNNKNLATSYTSAGPLIGAILKNSMVIAGIIFLFLLVFGGIMFISSAGSSDSKKAAQAQSAITSAVIGFAVIFSAYFIIQIIQVITGVQILNSNL